jgi:hypothetical protein
MYQGADLRFCRGSGLSALKHWGPEIRVLVVSHSLREREIEIEIDRETEREREKGEMRDER